MSDTLFHESFGYAPAISGFTPGRVNLIGEHTDYNGGLVLPTALKLGVTISLAPRRDNQIKVVSKEFDGICVGTLEDKARNHWADYVIGSMIKAKVSGLTEGGADIAIASTLPHGAGLSSSAALTVGLLKLCRDHQQQTQSDIQIAQMARSIENDYIGVPCGIMDQVAVAIAKTGEAIKLDTQTLDYEIISLPETHHMVVIHSGQYRRLNEGRYKERKEECDHIKDTLRRDDICLIDQTDLEKLRHLPNHIQDRARHCMTEHQRTQTAAQALKAQNMLEFGRLMVESHTSMKDHFDITLPAIDKLVEDAVQLGALGARMTGGGFGGCIVACVDKDQVQGWTETLLSHHPEAFHVC